MIKKIFHSRLVIHLYWWIFIYLLFFHLLGPMDSETLRWALFFYFFFIVLPIDFHFFIIYHFLKRKKYLIYGICLLIIIVIMSLLTNIYNINFLASDDTLFKNFLEVSLVLLIATAIKIIKDGFKQKIKLQEIQAKHLQTELQLLKSQVNPHFLFNTLNNIYSLSLDSSRKLPRMIKKLSDLMSYMFESSKNQQVSLEKEIEFIDNYLTMEKLRLPLESDVYFSVNGNVHDRIIAPMLFIPLVENCFKHGAKATAGKFFVHIYCTIEKNKIIFLTENNVGFDNNISYKRTGLSNVRRRLELLYPEHHNLDIKKGKNTFKVRMEIYQ